MEVNFQGVKMNWVHVLQDDKVHREAWDDISSQEVLTILYIPRSTARVGCEAHEHYPNSGNGRGKAVTVSFLPW